MNFLARVFLRADAVFSSSLEFFRVVNVCARRSSREHSRPSAGTLFIYAPVFIRTRRVGDREVHLSTAKMILVDAARATPKEEKRIKRKFKRRYFLFIDISNLCKAITRVVLYNKKYLCTHN